jgi:hypothetical protein
MERNQLAREAHADALVASGRAEEAARLVFEEGLRRGDIPLATEALEIATDNGLLTSPPTSRSTSWVQTTGSPSA